MNKLDRRTDPGEIVGLTVIGALAVGAMWTLSVAYISGGVAQMAAGGAIAAPTPLVGVLPVFQDGFETGDTSSLNRTDLTQWQSLEEDTVVGPTLGHSYVSSVEAYEGTYSLAFRCFASDGDVDNGANDCNAEVRFWINSAASETGTGYSEIWIESWDLIPENFVMRNAEGPDNNKFERVWGGAYADSDPKMGAEFRPVGGVTSDSAVIRGQYGDAQAGQGIDDNPVLGDTPMIGCLAAGCLIPGTWTKVQRHYKLASSASANDGEMTYCAGGQVVFTADTLDVFGTGTAGNTFNQGYLYGAANTGYGVETIIYRDNFKIFIEEPAGWCS